VLAAGDGGPGFGDGGQIEAWTALRRDVAWMLCARVEPGGPAGRV